MQTAKNVPRTRALPPCLARRPCPPRTRGGLELSAEQPCGACVLSMHCDAVCWWCVGRWDRLTGVLSARRRLRACLRSGLNFAMRIRRLHGPSWTRATRGHQWMRVLAVYKGAGSGDRLKLAARTRSTKPLARCLLTRPANTARSMPRVRKGRVWASVARISPQHQCFLPCCHDWCTAHWAVQTTEAAPECQRHEL